MKNCLYCCQPMEVLARKCQSCHSYQDPKDVPTSRIDVATLVISFVGVITIIATLVGGAFAYFGFATVRDINERYEKVTQKNNDLLDSTRKLSEKLSQDQLQFEADQKRLITSVQASQNQLNISYVKEQLNRFDQIMDDITLDELYNTPNLIGDIQDIRRGLSDISPIPTAVEPIVSDIKSLVTGVLYYKDGRYEECINALKSVADENVNKHRLMVAVYQKLYDQVRKDQKREEAVKYAALQKAEAQRYYDIVKNSSRRATIALINLATSLITRNEEGDLDKALTYLNEAKKKEPQRSLIYYNIAAVFVGKHQLPEALTNLETAKNYGDFSTEADIKYFNDDPWFAELRSTDVPAYVDRLSKLRSLQK